MQKQQIMDYEKAVNYILSLPRFTPGYTLEDTKKYLKKLGNPEKKANIIHVAGTNGKGSVCAYLCSALEAAGYHWCRFTSPHLQDIRERFVIDGEMISKEDFLQAFLKIQNMLDWEKIENGVEYQPTFFDYLFLMSVLIFADTNATFWVLETGLGGRLDATNAISHKEMTVITHMGLDHTEYLGDSLEKIAGEKAGIMHEGSPVVYWETNDEVTEVLSKHAKELKIMAEGVSKIDYRFLKFNDKTIDFSYRSLYYDSVRLHLKTIARYQMENAVLALRALEILLGQEAFTKEAMQKGMEKAFWAGRMEEILPEVYVDGAHNADGIRAFLESVEKDGCTTGRKLLFGALSDKSYDSMIEEIVKSGLFSDISVVQLKSARALNVESLRREVKIYWGQDVVFYHSVRDAFDSETALCAGKMRLYIAGSLYLVGEIKEFV